MTELPAAHYAHPDPLHQACSLSWIQSLHLGASAGNGARLPELYSALPADLTKAMKQLENNL